MATKQVCDVFGTAKGLEKVRITMTVPASGDMPERTLCDETAELGTRGMARAARFIKRATMSAADWKQERDKVHDDG